MPRLPLLLALAAALGASAAAGTGTLALWPDGSGHAHGDPAQHAGAGFGMARLGYLNLGEAIGEVDVHAGADGRTWVLVALLNAGFALVDGTDPASPRLASVARSAVGGYGADAKMADDTNTVYLSINSGSSLPPCFLGPSPVIAPVPVPLVCGVQVWDTTDKANPVFLMTLPTSTAGSHMMDYEVFGGVAHIAMAAQGNPQNVPVAVVPADKVPVVVGHLPTGFNHDVTLRPDPLTGAPAAFVANWDSGVRAYDLTFPAAPVELGSWAPPSGSGGHIHTVMPMEVEGRRILVAEQESFGQNLVSKLFFLDATDYGDIRLLATWGNPDGKLANNGFVRWSTHNFNVEGGKLYLAHYHGGVLVLDVGSLAKLASPPILGNHLPNMPRVSGAFGTDVPFTWDAYPHAGTVWATDINSGLYALRLV